MHLYGRPPKNYLCAKIGTNCAETVDTAIEQNRLMPHSILPLNEIIQSAEKYVVFQRGKSARAHGSFSSCDHTPFLSSFPKSMEGAS